MGGPEASISVGADVVEGVLAKDCSTGDCQIWESARPLKAIKVRRGRSAFFALSLAPTQLRIARVAGQAREQIAVLAPGHTASWSVDLGPGRHTLALAAVAERGEVEWLFALDVRPGSA